MVLRASRVALALLLIGCGDSSFSGSPQDQGPPQPPTDPPPTGSKWQATETPGECGRTGLEYRLVDEVCGGTEDPAYMSYFHAPIMRDGALIGTDLFAVDATYMWVLDVADPAAPVRRALHTGFGQPLAVSTHAGRLVIAAGDEGLIVAEVSDPANPVRFATIPIEYLAPEASDAHALDVFVEGDRAFVALGAAGVAIVDLELFTVEKRFEVQGFAAAVAAKDGLLFAAACTNMGIIDVETGAHLGQAWLPDAVVDGVLVAPLKDVSIEGDVAFLAAGRFGAIAFDVSDPTAPALLGNCTESDPLFYASGVRSFGDRLYVAGGEWGILPLPITDPLLTCTSLAVPAIQMPPPPEEGECSTEPPWKEVQWTESWAPPPVPPEGRDPVQTLPIDGLVFAFGDATRIGLRAIDLRDTTDPALPKLGRYSEPRLTEGIAVHDDRLLVTGKAGGLFDIVADELVTSVDLPEARESRAAAFLEDGRWVLGMFHAYDDGSVLIEGASSALHFYEPMWPGALVARGNIVYWPVKGGVIAIDGSGPAMHLSSGSSAELPASMAIENDRLIVAAPEWPHALGMDVVATDGQLSTANVQPLDSAPVDEQALADVGVWRRGLPRRHLFATAAGLVEVASLGSEAGLMLHGSDAGVTTTLPNGDYIAGATDGARVFLVAVDRGRYRTMLVTVSLGEGGPAIASVQAFTGMATGLAATQDRLYLADGDRGIRTYVTETDEPALLSITDLSIQNGGAQ